MTGESPRQTNDKGNPTPIADGQTTSTSLYCRQVTGPSLTRESLESTEELDPEGPSKSSGLGWCRERGVFPAESGTDGPT